ncbi:hypothetical protein LXL04_024926 [Taraxacum kok-saghyz]
MLTPKLFNNSVRNLSSFVAYLNWVWDFFIHLSFFYHQTLLLRVSKGSQTELISSPFSHDWSSTEPVECPVCLSAIEEDEEISVLRCKHLFHRNCIDRCIEHRHMTCPLCRDYLAGPRMVCELGRELIVFTFGGDGGSSDDEFDKWWLR